MLKNLNDNFNKLKTGINEIKNKTGTGENFMENIKKQISEGATGTGENFMENIKKQISEGAQHATKMQEDIMNKKGENDFLRSFDNKMIKENREELYSKIDVSATDNILKMRDAINIINKYSDFFPFPIMLHKKNNYYYLSWEKIPENEIKNTAEFENNYIHLNKIKIGNVEMLFETEQVAFKP